MDNSSRILTAYTVSKTIINSFVPEAAPLLQVEPAYPSLYMSHAVKKNASRYHVPSKTRSITRVARI